MKIKLKLDETRLLLPTESPMEDLQQVYITHEIALTALIQAIKLPVESTSLGTLQRDSGQTLNCLT